MTPEQFTKEILEPRKILMQQLLQLCAQDLQKESPLNVLLTMRMQIEQLLIDMKTVTTSLLALSVIEPEKYAITLNRVIEERVKQLQTAQSKIIMVKR